MVTPDELASLTATFEAAFPSLTGRPDLARQPHAHWVELRPELPLLLAAEVVNVLPYVLLDLASTLDRCRFEDADLVVCFLAVRPAGWGGPARSESPDASAVDASSFVALTRPQAAAVCGWLEFVFDTQPVEDFAPEVFRPDLSPGEWARQKDWAFERCEQELWDAYAYWMARADQALEQS
jgi:hypothetical protein